MKTIGVRNYALDWFWSSINGVYPQSLKNTSRVPHGPILGLLFSTIYANVFPDTVESFDVFHVRQEHNCCIFFHLPFFQVRFFLLYQRKGWLFDFNLLFNVMKSKLMCSCKTDREFLIGKEVLTDADVVIYRGINIHKTLNWPYREQPNYIQVECVKTWLFSRHAKLPEVLISSSLFVCFTLSVPVVLDLSFCLQ